MWTEEGKGSGKSKFPGPFSVILLARAVTVYGRARRSGLQHRADGGGVTRFHGSFRVGTRRLLVVRSMVANRIGKVVPLGDKRAPGVAFDDGGVQSGKTIGQNHYLLSEIRPPPDP